MRIKNNNNTLCLFFLKQKRENIIIINLDNILWLRQTDRERERQRGFS